MKKKIINTKITSYDTVLERMDMKSFMTKISWALNDKQKLKHEQGRAEEHKMQCLLLLLWP